MSSRADGYTLAELMVTVAIAAILMTIAVPAMQDLIAGQRVRTAASELMTDLSYARADAISNGRRVAVARLDQNHDLWNSGWRLIVCANSDGASNCPNLAVLVPCTSEAAGSPGCVEEIKRRQVLSGRVKVCTRMNPATAPVDAPAIIFGPDGRMSAPRPGAPLGINAFVVSDDMSDAIADNDKIRSLEFGASGRVSLYAMNSAQGGVTCP